MSIRPTNLHKRATDQSRQAALAFEQRQRAIAAGPGLASFADRLFKRFGVDITPVDIKSKRRLSHKATKDYGGRFDMVGDTVRLKVICDTADQVAKVQQQLWRQREMAISRLGRRAELQEYPAEPIIIGIKDYFAEPKTHGYRALNTKIQMPNGVTAEIQVVHRGMEAMSTRTHGTYKQLSELLREVGDQDFTPHQARRYEALVTRLSNAYEGLAETNGLNKLVTGEAKAAISERRQWLKRLVAVADARYADKMGFEVSDETRTLAGIAAAVDPGQPRLRNGHNPSPTQRALSNRIELAIASQQRWIDDPDSVSKEERDMVVREVSDLAKHWDDMTPALHDRMIEGGIAPSGAARLRQQSKVERIAEPSDQPVNLNRPPVMRNTVNGPAP